MKAKVNISKEINLNQIVIGDYTLSEILTIINSKATECLCIISFEKQSKVPDLTDLDAPLHAILNLIEDIT